MVSLRTLERGFDERRAYADDETVFRREGSVGRGSFALSNGRFYELFYEDAYKAAKLESP